MSLDIHNQDASGRLRPDRRVGSDEEPSAVAQTDFSPVRERPPQQRPPQEHPPGGDRPRERADEEGAEQHHEQSGERGKGLLRRHPIAFAIGLAWLIAALPIGYLYWNYSNHFESTEDAYIASRQFAIAPEVPGYITVVPVTDNQHVAAGAVIALIDDRLYRAALDNARAQVAAARANIENVDAQLSVQQSQIAADQAKVNQQQAALVFAKQQAARYQYLANTIAGTVQNAQNYTSQSRQQQAALDSAEATLKLAQRQIDGLKAQRDSARASLAQAKAQRQQAKLNVSYTTVKADQAGRVVQLSAADGQYAQAGANLTMFVPDDIWVWANFKETQLDRMRPGQPVTISIDAYPERTIRGHVASVQPGSGTAFSLLPVQNATGNWVKIVQRVPVKIVMDNPPTDVALGPGMSIDARVRIDANPSLYERLRGWI